MAGDSAQEGRAKADNAEKTPKGQTTQTTPTTPKSAKADSAEKKPAAGSDVSTSISRFAFIFLIYALITSGYITETLSCQMRHFLVTTRYGRHMFGVIMVFVFIMFEGGWSWNKEDDEAAENDWSSGNVGYSLLMALAIYTVFLISSKSRLIPNLIFFGLSFLIYCINTQRAYWKARDRISEEGNARLILVSKAMLAVAIFILIFGFIDYIVYQKGMHSTDFGWGRFLLGTGSCSSLADVGKR